jgi:hypothetical protein
VTEEGVRRRGRAPGPRIAAAGHGGQVLVSVATVALVERSGLHDLGEHRFNDLAAAERVWQLGDGDLPTPEETPGFRGSVGLMVGAGWWWWGS